MLLTWSNLTRVHFLLHLWHLEIWKLSASLWKLTKTPRKFPCQIPWSWIWFGSLWRIIYGSLVHRSPPKMIPHYYQMRRLLCSWVTKRYQECETILFIDLSSLVIYLTWQLCITKSNILRRGVIIIQLLEYSNQSVFFFSFFFVTLRGPTLYLGVSKRPEKILRIKKNNNKKNTQSLTHYPIIVLMHGSHGLSARRPWRTLSSRPEGPQPRSRVPEGP